MEGTHIALIILGTVSLVTLPMAVAYVVQRRHRESEGEEEEEKQRGQRVSGVEVNLQSNKQQAMLAKDIENFKVNDYGSEEAPNERGCDSAS